MCTYISPRYGDNSTLLSQWRFGWGPSLSNVKQWYQTTVPTSIQWALHQAGVIPHPYESVNAPSLTWIEDATWWFVTELPTHQHEESDTAPASAVLVFDGLDYYADVFLNGKPAATHEGMFGGPVLPLSASDLRHPVEVAVRLRAAGDGKGRKRWQCGKIVKPDIMSRWLGNDYLMTVGIPFPVRLEKLPPSFINIPCITTLEIEAAPGSGRARSARLKFAADIITSTPGRWTISLSALPTSDTASPIEQQFTTADLPAGTHHCEFCFSVANPYLWNPVGMGSPALYRGVVTLAAGEQHIDRVPVTFGVRTFALDTDGPNPSWEVYINGERTYLTGVNWMPQDLLYLYSPARYRWFLQAAMETGLQMVRVWGGGLVEAAPFYEACDELGLLVWQDLPLNCAYRCGELDQRLWRQQVEWSVSRLRNHPSLAVWCGGNEFDPYHEDNVAHIEIAREVVENRGEGRPFLPASPALNDIHDYPGYDPMLISQQYGEAPFVSEWGMHSMPDPETLRQYVGPDYAAQVCRLFSHLHEPPEDQVAELLHHWTEFKPDRTKRFISFASAYADIRAATAAQTIEACNLGAAEYTRLSAEQFRLQYPVTNGYLGWVLNRTWPTVGAQLIDWHGRPLPALYALQAAGSTPLPVARFAGLIHKPGASLVAELFAVTEPNGPKLHHLTCRIYAPDLALHGVAQYPIAGAPGPAGVPWVVELGRHVILPRVPSKWHNQAFFLHLDLADTEGHSVGSNAYYLRCSDLLATTGHLPDYPFHEEGPWLLPQLHEQGCEAQIAQVETRQDSQGLVRGTVTVTNTGTKPMPLVHIHPLGAPCLLSENLFWLDQGAKRRVDYLAQGSGPRFALGY